MTTSRPGVLTAAALLLGLVSLLKVEILFGGQPLPVQVIAILVGLIGLVAAYGLWQAKRWGMIVALIISVLNLLAAAASFATQSSLPLAIIMGGVMLVISVLVIVLILLPSARQAYA